MPLFGRSHEVDSPNALGRLVVRQHARITRLWARRLKSEIREPEVSARELREPLDRIAAELGRILRDRGEDAVWLFGETIRAHGLRRFEQRYDVEDVARELATLHTVVLHVLARTTGPVAPEHAKLLAAVFGEATGSTLAAYARALRTEEVRFREAAAMETILHHLDVGVLLIDADGTVAYATPSVKKLVGLPIRALVGTKAAETLRRMLSQVHAKKLDGEPFRTSDVPYVRSLEEGRRVSGVWMMLSRPPEGDEVVLEMEATPLLDETSGEPYGAVQTLTDRTELHRYHTRQQALVLQATETAHALNNSLNVVRLKLGLLRKAQTKELEPHLDEIERALESASERVKKLQEQEASPTKAEAEVGLPSAPRRAAPSARKEARRVLVVDDDAENADVLAEVLAGEGYEVETAKDGTEAGKVWKEDSFDAALIDAVMPDVSGWELAKSLREQSPDATLAVVTGADIRGIRREDMEPLDAVFQKPVGGDVLDEFLSGRSRKTSDEPGS